MGMKQNRNIYKTKSRSSLTNISDGDHTINIYVRTRMDGFNESFVFNVDNCPTLLLKSPTNGSGFDENGNIKCWGGITEEDAYITVNIAKQ